MKESRTKSTWHGMKTRCTNANTLDWPHYGGRGLSFDPRWQDFENFLADMGEAPAGKSLDRIDNNGNYSKSNCRWVSPTENNRNSSRVKLTAETVCAIKLRLKEEKRGLMVKLAAEFKVPYYSIKDLKYGNSWADVGEVA